MKRMTKFDQKEDYFINNRKIKKILEVIPEALTFK